jgi:hypothetical protein
LIEHIMHRSVYLVATHFPPSNLASVHRARLLANHLGAHGWEPTVLTVDPRYYEERTDPDLEKLVDPGVRIERVRAISQGITRPLAWGDLGIRAWPHLYRALAEAAARRRMELVHITIPSNYPALLGRLLWQRHRIPYVVDYIDPWVPETDQGARFPSKAWASFCLAEWLEPVAVKRASGIAGITGEYFHGVIRRNPHLKDVPQMAFQYGCSRRDHEIAGELPVPVRRIEKVCAAQQVVYAGALLPKAIGPMQALIGAIREANRSGKRKRPLRLICLGTGSAADDAQGYRVLPLARSVGAEEWVREYPERHPYLEVLKTLAASDGVVVVGSTEAHYSPSKIFQAVLARKPVLALLHRQSEGGKILTASGAGTWIPFDSQLNAEELKTECANVLSAWPSPTPPEVKWDLFESYDARTIAGGVAAFYEQVLAFHRRMTS